MNAHPASIPTDGALFIGSSIGSARGGSGTLGCFAKRGRETFLVSTATVLAPQPQAKLGDWIHSPARPEVKQLSARTSVARLEAFASPTPEELADVDAATARLEKWVHHRGNRLPDYDGFSQSGREVDRILSAKEIKGMLPVAKFGRTTGFTRGFITAWDCLIKVNTSAGLVTFTGLIEITGDGPEAFSLHGDGGALVFAMEPFGAIGIIVAGTAPRTPEQPDRAYVCPLQRVLDRFDLQLL